MKELRFRLIIILLFTILCVYLLYPTYSDYQNSKKITRVLDKKRQEFKVSDQSLTKDQVEQKVRMVEDSIKASDPAIAETRQKRVKLGLDLQGGMRVVLEVNTGKLLEKLAKSPDDTFKKVLADAEKQSTISEESVVDIVGSELKNRGIRLSRYFGSIREDDSQIISKLKRDADDAVTRAMEIIRNRVDQYGVSEPSIVKQGSRRVIVELPGVAREEEAKQLLQGTALLEFRLVKDPEFTFAVMQKIDNVLAGKPVIDSTAIDSTASKDSSTASNDSVKTKDTTQTANADTSGTINARNHPFFFIAHLSQQSKNADAYVEADNRAKLQMLINRPDVQAVIPDNVEFVYSNKPIAKEGGKDFYLLYCVNKVPELTGGVITNAQSNIDPTTSQPIVNMEMNSDGASEWARITGANINKRIAIILDGVVYSAPNVINKISGGHSQITGMANLEEAKLLEIILKAGALPAPVDIIEERTVGPSLGEDSIKDGFTSLVIGFLLVAVFMIIYYRRAGDIAAVSLIFTVLFILGVLAGFKATLTLPGIAGIILTIGMAVDANVLIYERIREELATGKTMKASVDSGFAKANAAIVDSNITTFLTGIILYQFGSGPVQGFALTLMIGIIASLFSALVIARVAFDYLVSKGAKISLG